MVPGDEIVGRFVIDEISNAGSYTTLYRAHDRATGENVALKVMGGLAGSDLVRFSREARLLAEQHHPGIVRYIAHGVTPQGAPWLAMEWLDGETLADRLDRGALPYDDALTVAGHIAAALSELHRLGVVHRDIKPANLFLPAGDVSRTKVLDLGIARVPTLARRSPTRVGTILGTPGYMAPEQVRGAAEIDARADVFALGCVLFECLTGRPAIDGDSVESLLGRTLLEDCPRLADLMPQAPPALDQLVARMVARDPSDRPADGAAVVEALDGFIRQLPPRPPTALASAAAAAASFESATDPAMADPFSARTAPGSPTLLALDDAAPTAPPSAPAPCLGDSERRLLSVALLTQEGVGPDVSVATLRIAAESFGAQLEVLWGNMVMVVIRASGAATDQAARGARCALALRTLAPNATVALATGWAEESGHGAIGEVIDRAAALLHDAVASAAEGDGGPRPIRIGEVDAGLLDARFEIARAQHGYELAGEREVVETARPVLGRATPCVGRRRELATLDATLEECLGEPVARAVLLTGAPGVGKSRLRHEFERAVRERHPEVEVWSTRGDPQHVNAPFVLLAPLVRRLAGFAPTDPIPVRRQKLRARVGRNVAPGERQRVAEFLGEMVGTSFPDAESVNLRLARLDATLMSAQVRRAWEDFVAAECAARPLLLVIEDLQWGDVLSVRHVDAALRALGEKPFMVLAVGRPELHEAFPGMWVERGLQEVRVGPLTRRAVEALARECLGDRLDGPALARIVERSGGNAFYLEELIRSVGKGRGVGLPGTVLAMVHARLGALDPAARRVLRAASIFGERFWRGGVAALLGEDPAAGRTPEWLAALEDRELVVPVPEGRYPGDQEYVFQSPQLRDAAYGMLTEADRMVGHRQAAAWLERAGEADPVTLGEHLERGGAPARAVGWYLEATRRALEANELGGVLARAERGVSCGASGPTLGALLRLQAEAHRWRGENADAVRCGTDATRLLTQGDPQWFQALRETVIACGRLGDRDALTTLAVPLSEAAPSPSARAAHASARAAAAVAALDAGLADLGAGLAALLDDPGAGAGELRGDVLRAHAAAARADGDLESHLTFVEDAARCFEASGNLREMCDLRVSVGRGRQLLGMHGRSLGPLREARAAARRLGLHHLSAVAELHLATAHFTDGSLDDARAASDRAIEAFTRQGSRRMAARARAVRCRIATALIDPERAAHEGERAAHQLDASPADQAWALACLAEAHLARRDVAAALAAAEQAVALLSAAQVACLEEAFVFLAHVDALALAGRHEAARGVAAAAHGRLMARAARIRNPAWRESYLTSVREHARVVTLQAQPDRGAATTVF